MREQTDVYQLYQDGLDYKNTIGYFTKCDLHWSFYNSQQWRGIAAKDLPKVTLNTIKQTIDYKVASIMSQNIAIVYSADNLNEIQGDYDTPEDIEKADKLKSYTELLTNIVKKKWEKEKMIKKTREALLNGGVTGDLCFYTYWNPNKNTNQLEQGDFCTDVIDGGNVFFANPNTIDVQNQDWIILAGRDSVKNLRKEAEEAGMSKDEVEMITGDEDNEYQTGTYGKIEMNNHRSEGKATYIIKFWKENGTVMWSKSTRYADIRKAVDMGIKRYPVDYANWGTVKNSMHGMSDAEGLIDNQISINQLHALTILWMRNNAFGKTLYDKTRIQAWSNSVTAAIGVEGDLTGAVQQLQAGNFNQAIVNYASLLMQLTKDVSGANDSALGQVDPKNTSAIAVSIKQSSIPLENIQANVYQLTEDWALTAGEFIMSKYNKRKVQIDVDGKNMMVDYEKPQEDIMLNVRVDVGPSSYFSETAGQQTLDNLFMQGKITDIQYYERMKKFNIIPDVEGLIEDIKEAQEAQKAQMQQQAQQQAEPDVNAIVSQMSPEIRARFEQLPQEQQQAFIQEFMKSQNMQ